MAEKKERERLVFSPEEQDRMLMKDGKKYRLLKETVEGGHIKEVIFEEVDESVMSEKMDKIADYLVSASQIDAKMIIKDLLKQMSTDEIDKLEKQVKREEPVVIVPGCLSLKIGKRRIIEVVP
jgi:signal transduction protein with GAF and PtsI domain